jgi:hypothetical protein
VFSATFGGAAGLVTCGYEAVAETPEIEPGSRMGPRLTLNSIRISNV